MQAEMRQMPGIGELIDWTVLDHVCMAPVEQDKAMPNRARCFPRGRHVTSAAIRLLRRTRLAFRPTIEYSSSQNISSL